MPQSTRRPMLIFVITLSFVNLSATLHISQSAQQFKSLGDSASWSLNFFQRRATLEFGSDVKETLNDVAWLHIPKCGTSFGNTLLHWANSSLSPRVMFDESDLPRREKGHPAPLKQFSEEWSHSLNFTQLFWKGNRWFNHDAIKQTDWERWGGNFVAIFRRPADRLNSQAHYFDGFGSGRVRYTGDPQTYFENNKATMTLMLSGQRDGLASPAQFDEVPSTDLAVERLKAFKFVGLVEHWALSMCLFHVMLGGTCTQSDFMNVRPGTYSSATSDEGNEFENWTDEDDERVYKVAQQIFWHNVQKYNVTRKSCMRTCRTYTAPFEVEDELLVARPAESHDFRWPSSFVVEED